MRTFEIAVRVAGRMRARRRHRETVGLALVVAISGCNWNDFDTSLSKAPVLSLGAPSGYSSPDVGRVMLPLTVPAALASTVAARFLIAGTQTPSLAVVDLDAAGHAKSQSASQVEMADMVGEAKAVVKSAVELADHRILLGTPSYSTDANLVPEGRVYFLTLTDKADGSVGFAITRGQVPGAPGTRFSYGLGVATGNVSGTATPDLVVASVTDVALAEDGNEAALVAPVPTCDLHLDDPPLEKYRYRALAVGDLVAGGADEIAVGVPREPGGLPGRVAILSRGATGLECPIWIAAPGMEARFGNSVAVADFNGDGKLDLLVGAPPSRAYLFNGPFAAAVAAAPTLMLKHPTIPDTADTGDFGFRVLGVEADGMPGLEIAVSAPDLAVGAQARAGQVFVWKRDGTLFTPVQDFSPNADAAFGFSLAALPFSPGGCAAARPVLLVGAIPEVFTFFRLPGGPADPRCFGK